MSQPLDPESPTSPKAVARSVDLAEILVRRWAATVIDLILLGVVVIAPVVTAPEKYAGPVLLAVLVPLVVYYPITEGLWGQTLGKKLLGIVVVNAAGEPPGIGRAAVRTLLRLFEVNPFLLGAIPAALCVMITPTRQRLGDNLADTYVIPVSRLVRQPAMPRHVGTVS